MPIKFKCSCGKVLSVPEKMAGKNGKCPKCQKGLKVPVPKPKPVAKTKAAKTATASASAPASVMDSLFEDAGLEKSSGPVCSQCGTAIGPGTVICTSCGFNFESGEQIDGYDAKTEGPEFDNFHLQDAADNIKRDLVGDDRRAKAAMPWWVLASFLIGAITLCGAGVVIVDGMIGTYADQKTFIGKVQRWPVFITLGLTASITGLAITVFAHLSICMYAFSKSVAQGFACFLLPLLYSFVYGIMNWTNNKAPVKAIMMALVFIGLGVFLIIQGGGFNKVMSAF